jgi:hypothetical protein
MVNESGDSGSESGEESDHEGGGSVASTGVYEGGILPAGGVMVNESGDSGSESGEESDHEGGSSVASTVDVEQSKPEDENSL